MNNKQESPPHAEKRGLSKRAKLAVIGPAFVVGALQFGPGSVVSAASAGASLGYGVIWLIALSTVFMLVFVDMAVRVGLAYGVSSIQAIKAQLGSPVGFLTGLAMFLAAFSFMVGNILGSALGLNLIFGGPVKVWSVVLVVAVLALLWTKRYYSILEKLALIVIGVMVLAFAITAIWSQPDWMEVAGGFIPTSFAGDPVLAMALVGTNLSMYASFYMTYSIREKGTRLEQYKETTLNDTLGGVIAPGIITILIVIAGASVIGAGQDVSGAEGIANILRPTLGSAAVVIFALGLFAAGISSVSGGLAAGGTCFADGAGWGDKVDTSRVRIVATVGLLISLTIALVFNGVPVQLIILFNAFTLFVFPFLATVFLILANNGRMGALKNTWWQNVLGAMGWLIVCVGAVRLVIALV